MIIWLIGMSGVGKTAIGERVYRKLKKIDPATVFVDGDVVRGIFKHDAGDDPYSIKQRKIAAERLTEICSWLDKQNINVVCCTISTFEKPRGKNREVFSKYFEVFVQAPLEILVERDVKNLYKPALEGRLKNVVGVDIEYETPKHPDLLIDNSFNDDDLDDFANIILKKAFGGEV